MLSEISTLTMKGNTDIIAQQFITNRYSKPSIHRVSFNGNGTISKAF